MSYYFLQNSTFARKLRKMQGPQIQALTFLSIEFQPLYHVGFGLFGRCGRKEFSCTSGNQCVSLAQRCDSIPNCYDYSDELDCDYRDVSFRRAKRGRGTINLTQINASNCGFVFLICFCKL